MQAQLIGGLETYCRDLALALRDMGHSVEVISVLEPSQAVSGWGDIAIRGLAPTNHTLFRLYMHIWTMWLTVYLYLLHRQIRYDYVFIMHPFAAYSAYQAGLRNYYVCNYGIEVWGEWSERLTIGLKNAYHLIAISQHTRSVLVEHFSDKKISIIYPIVDITKFVPPKITRRVPPYVLLTVGRLVTTEAYKGHEKIIRNLNRIQEHLELEVEYWIVGDGDDRSRLEQIARDSAVLDRVKFLGRVSSEQLVLLYQECNIFIMPSSGEGFGIVYLEAGACAKPVIGSIVGGATDAVQDGVTGLCVDPQSDDMLVNSVTELLLKPDYAYHLGKAGRARIEHSFSRDSLIRSLETLLGKR